MRVRLLHDIAAALVDVDCKDIAAAICHEAVPFTWGFVEKSGGEGHGDFTGMGDRALALGDLAEELGRSGDADGAWRVGGQALQAAAASVARCQMCHAVGLRFARGMVAAGDVGRAATAISQAGEACGFEPTARRFAAEIGLEIAPLLHARGEGRAAAGYLESAAHVADRLDGEAADDLRGALVIALDETEQTRAALQVLDTIADPFVRASLLRALAERRAADGKPEEGVRLANASLDGLDGIDRLIDRIDTQAGAAAALARCHEHQAARQLAGTALQGLESLDAQWHARPLGRIATTAELAGDHAMAAQAFALAKLDLLDSFDGRPLAEMAAQVIRAGGPDAAERITQLVAGLADPELGQEIKGLATLAHLDAGDVPTALRVWLSLVDDDRLADLPALVGTLSHGLPAIASLDSGHTLVALHRALADVRAWWKGTPASS